MRVFRTLTIALAAIFFATILNISHANDLVKDSTINSNNSKMQALFVSSLESNQPQANLCKTAATVGKILVADREPICCGQCTVSGTGQRGCILRDKEGNTYCSPC